LEEDEQQPEQPAVQPLETRVFGIPVALTVEVGPGIVYPGRPTGVAKTVFVAPAESVEAVALAVIGKVQGLATVAYRRAEHALTKEQTNDDGLELVT
jgi:hypothetical protein